MISPSSQQYGSFQSLPNMSQGTYSTTNIIPIHGGREGALNYPVAAGYTALLLDEETKTFFIKTGDVSGIPKPMREFTYEEVTPSNPNSIDMSQFATKQDFEMLLNEVRKLQGNSRDNGRRYNNYNGRIRRTENNG